MYSGNLGGHLKNKYLSRDAHSPAVPMPAHAKLTFYSHKAAKPDKVFNQELKTASQGINFEIDTADKRKKDLHKSSISHK